MSGLTAEQIEQFETEGFLLVEDLFDPEQDIAPILEEYAGVLDILANDLYEQGLISSTYAELPFSDRLTASMKRAARCIRSISIFRSRKMA